MRETETMAGLCELPFRVPFDRLDSVIPRSCGFKGINKKGLDRMKKSLLSILLVTAMLVSVLSACGSGASSSGGSESAVAPDNGSQVEPAPEEPVQTAEASAEDASAMEGGSAAEPEPAVEISYPLDTDVTLQTWATMKGTYTAAFDEWNQCYILDYAAEATGVGLDVISVSDTVASEQFQLLIASGDWPDFIPMTFYTGGASQAYIDDVIIELTDELLEENAPAYLQRIAESNESTQKAVYESGTHLSVFSVMDEPLVGAGLVIRQDWLDGLGMDTPTTLEGFTDALYGFRETYGASGALRLYTQFSLEQFNAAFDTRCVGYANSNIPVYVNDGTVTCSFVEDNYRAFVEWIAQLYADGIVDQDFYSLGNGGPDRFGDVVAGKNGLWSDNAGTVNDWTRWADDPNLLDAEAIANPLGEDGTNTWKDELMGIGDMMGITGWCITSTAEDPALVLQYFNYFFTDEGSMMGNYGVEGIGYAVEDDGTVNLLDAITNSEYGINPGGAISINSMLNLVPHYQYEKRLFSTLDEDAIEAYEIFNDESITGEHYYPNAAALTSGESDSVINEATAVLTYAQETLLAFMTNAMEINDETWDAFQRTLEDMGIREILEVYQNAYDAYAAGER